MPFDPISYALAKNAMKYSKSIKPDWEVIAEVEPETDVDYVEFTGLDINSDKAYVIFVTAKNPQTSDTRIKIYVNGDLTDTDYYSQYIHATGTNVSANRLNLPYVTFLGAGKEAFAVVIVSRSADGYLHAYVARCHRTGSEAELTLVHVASAVTFTNITSIRLAVDITGGIGAGSKFILARVKRP